MCCMCFLKSLFYSNLFQNELLPSTFRACTPLMQVPYVPECPWEHKALARVYKLEFVNMLQEGSVKM